MLRHRFGKWIGRASVVFIRPSFFSLSNKALPHVRVLCCWLWFADLMLLPQFRWYYPKFKLHRYFLFRPPVPNPFKSRVELNPCMSKNLHRPNQRVEYAEHGVIHAKLPHIDYHHLDNLNTNQTAIPHNPRFDLNAETYEMLWDWIKVGNICINWHIISENGWMETICPNFLLDWHTDIVQSWLSLYLYSNTLFFCG